MTRVRVSFAQLADQRLARKLALIGIPIAFVIYIGDARFHSGLARLAGASSIGHASRWPDLPDRLE